MCIIVFPSTYGALCDVSLDVGAIRLLAGLTGAKDNIIADDGMR